MIKQRFFFVIMSVNIALVCSDRMSPGITVLNNKNDCKQKKTSQETIALTKDDKSSLLVYKLKGINCPLLKMHTKQINCELVKSLTIKDSEIQSLENVNNLLPFMASLYIYESRIDKFALSNYHHAMVVQSNKLSLAAALELRGYGERLLDEKTLSLIKEIPTKDLQDQLNVLGQVLEKAEKKSLIILNNEVSEYK